MQKKFQIGLIRVLTTEDEELLNRHGKTIMEKYPMLEVESRCIPDQYEGIHSHELERLAVPKIVALAKEFRDKDMILVSCADDPGVAEVREALPGMLVTGGGETTVALATRYGKKIGLLGIVEYAPKAYVRMIPDKLVGNIKPDGVNSTLDLMTPEGRKNCLKAAMDLKNMGAEVIALGCTGLATIGIAREIEEVTGIPVIDPVLAQGAFAAFEAAKRM